MPRLRHTIERTLGCLVAVASPVGAQVGVSKNPSIEAAMDRTDQASGWSASDLGVLIGIVMIALIVIARNRNAP